MQTWCCRTCFSGDFVSDEWLDFRVFSNLHISLMLWVWYFRWNSWCTAMDDELWWDTRGARAGLVRSAEHADLTLSISSGSMSSGNVVMGNSSKGNKLHHQCLCPPDPKVHKGLKPSSIRAPKTPTGWGGNGAGWSRSLCSVLTAPTLVGALHRLWALLWPFQRLSGAALPSLSPNSSLVIFG